MAQQQASDNGTPSVTLDVGVSSDLGVPSGPDGITHVEAYASQPIVPIVRGLVILFGQRRISERLSTKREVPDALKGQFVEDIASAIRSGVLDPAIIRIEYFVDKATRALVSINSRGLAALSEAGLIPITHSYAAIVCGVARVS